MPSFLCHDRSGSHALVQRYFCRVEEGKGSIACCVWESMPNFRAGGRVASILMVFRAVSWKAAKLIRVTFLGIVISVSSLLPAKACWLIVSRFSGKCISLSPASAKARIPISLIVLGRCKVLKAS